MFSLHRLLCDNSNKELSIRSVLAMLKYESKSITAEVVDQIDDDAIRVEFDIIHVYI